MENESKPLAEFPTTDLINCGVEGLTLGSSIKPTAFAFGEDFKLDESGFHYKGESIKDLGKAYQRFMEFMERGYNPLINIDQEQLQTAEKLCALYKDAVIVLPDDTEPQVGDLVTNIGMKAWWVADIIDDKWYAVGKEYGFLKEAKIIQRNGKPVIYESALQQTERKEP